jgi:DNA-binding MarR family transcriptional regulator
MSRQVPRMDEVESEAWLQLVSVLELLPATLDAQLQQDSAITHFEYVVLSMLQFAPERTLRMKELATGTNSTLPRLSHVVSRLERRELVERFPCPEDRRATNVRLTGAGRRTVVRATPGHIATVRRFVLDALDRDQLTALAEIAGAVSRRLDPSDRFGRMLDAADRPGQDAEPATQTEAATAG